MGCKSCLFMLFFLPSNLSTLTPLFLALTSFCCRRVYSPKGRSVQNIVWPPIPDEKPELPTASPLYFPPSSLLHVHLKDTLESKTEADCQPWDIDDINIVMEQEPKMSICSAEVTSITGRNSTTECTEILTETLDTQLLVESILQKRPRSPPPLNKDISVEATIRIPESDIKSSTKLTQTSVEVTKKDSGEIPTVFTSNTLEYEKKSPSPKIVNSVPRKWESPLLTALKTVPDNSSDRDPFSNIPSKRPSSALASALTVAPTAPFTPTPQTTTEPVPLPEYTEPYLPPERSILLCKTDLKEEPFKEQPPPPYSPFVKALQIAPERPYSPVPEKPLRKKKQKEDPFLKDLPKPERELTMREALAVAPETPCAPLISEISVKFDNIKSLDAAHQKIRIQQDSINLQKPLKPATLPASFQVPIVSPPKPFISNFPPVSDQLKLKTEIEKQNTEQLITYSDNDTNAEQVDKPSHQIPSEKEQKMQDCIQEIIERQKENVVYKKPLPLTSSLRPADALPLYQVNLSENVEMELLMLEKQEILKKSSSKQQSAIEQQQFLNKPTITVQEEDKSVCQQPSRKPVIMIQPEDSQHLSQKAAFQPVVEDRPPSVSFSPRPRPITPSMINKPAPALPYYQANLVAQQYPAPGTNLFDPMSPSISRSPSPCPEPRSTSPFRPSSAVRAKSPAAGPPPSPLMSRDTLPTPKSLKVEQAKKSLTSYIPQHKEKMDFIEQQQNVTSQSTLIKDVDVEVSQSFNEKPSNVNKTDICSFYPGERECYKEDVIQKTKDGEERISKAFASSSASAHQEYVTADATTKVTQQQNLQHLEQSSSSESKSVQQLSDGKVQVERKKTVTEEFERTQKSKVVQIEKNIGTKCSFRNVNVSAIEEQQGIIGLHVTNPQPIVSPFISAEKNPVASIKQPAPSPKPQIQSQPNQQNLAYSASHTQPQLEPNALVNQKPKPFNPYSKATSSSTHSVSKPNIPVPHTGVGGGRQAGAVGVAPKRGRGVLNAAVLGSRIPLCGHCHSYVRYLKSLLLLICCLATNKYMNKFYLFLLLFLRFFLEHVCAVYSNKGRSETECDNKFSTTKRDSLLYNEINISIPSSSPEMNSLSPKEQNDKLAFNNRQNLLTEIRNYTPKIKTSSFLASKLSPSSIVLSGPCSPKNSFHICPQTSSTEKSTLITSFIPYSYNNNDVINEINLPDHLSFTNKINNESHNDVTTNKNNKTHQFDGMQPVCCVCCMKITRYIVPHCIKQNRVLTILLLFTEVRLSQLWEKFGALNISFVQHRSVDVPFKI